MKAKNLQKSMVVLDGLAVVVSGCDASLTWFCRLSLSIKRDIPNQFGDVKVVMSANRKFNLNTLHCSFHSLSPYPLILLSVIFCFVRLLRCNWHLWGSHQLYTSHQNFEPNWRILFHHTEFATPKASGTFLWSGYIEFWAYNRRCVTNSGLGI